MEILNVFVNFIILKSEGIDLDLYGEEKKYIIPQKNTIVVICRL